MLQQTTVAGKLEDKMNLAVVDVLLEQTSVIHTMGAVMDAIDAQDVKVTEQPVKRCNAAHRLRCGHRYRE
jgi:hypothetical protein